MVGLLDAASQRVRALSNRMGTDVWWRRCISAALINGVVWLTPPPIHLISLFMPFFSGYSIALSRTTKGLVESLQIGVVMGMTLGGAAMAAGLATIGVISWLLSGIPTIYLIVAVSIGGGIGIYTGTAACAGALVAAGRERAR
ncbi:MAG: hypothetical protein FJ320_08625 [SAR202 cluster bacterium]|nr:hypothetical protein [SAR202 cluster bacterium]